MQLMPHSCVAALAVPVAAALKPPTIASVATAASTFLLIDSAWADDEVTTDLLDLMGCGWHDTEPACLASPSRPCRPWSNSPACLLARGRGRARAVRSSDGGDSRCSRRRPHALARASNAQQLRGRGRALLQPAYHPVLDWRLARRLALDILLTEHMASDPWDHIRAAAMRGVNRAFS